MWYLIKYVFQQNDPDNMMDQTNEKRLSSRDNGNKKGQLLGRESLNV